MSEMIEYVSKVERWPGKIFTNSYMTFPELQKWEEAIEGTKSLTKSVEGDESTANTISFYGALLKPAMEIIKKWEIVGVPENVTVESFPASLSLVAFVVDSITDLYRRTNYTDPKSPEQS